MTMQIEQVWENIMNLWEQTPQEYRIVFTFVGAVFALLNCFIGYRLRKVWGCLLGLAAGGAGGTAAGYRILGDWTLALAAGAGCALILCLLAWVFYKLGVFVMCTGLVYFMAITMLDSPSLMTHLIVLVIGVFAGTLALGYERQMVIAITAFCGGIGGMGLLLAIAGVDSMAAQILLGLVLAVFGALVQALPYRNSSRAWNSEKESEMEAPKKTAPKKTVPKKSKPKKDHFDAEDYDDEDLEEIYEARKKERQKLYERAEASAGYGRRQGERIDLDDLNRELSKEIRKIYNDENTTQDN